MLPILNTKENTGSTYGPSPREETNDLNPTDKRRLSKQTCYQECRLTEDEKIQKNLHGQTQARTAECTPLPSAEWELTPTPPSHVHAESQPILTQHLIRNPAPQYCLPAHILQDGKSFKVTQDPES